jgi:adenylate cyclase
MMYPHSLAGRLAAQQQRTEAQAAAAAPGPTITAMDGKLTIVTQDVWDLWHVCLRLEMVCSALQSPGTTSLKSPETAMLDHMRNKGEVTDKFLLNIVEHQVTRIEGCVSTLSLRNMVRPLAAGTNLLSQACPLDDVVKELSAQLMEFKALKAKQDAGITS